MTVSQALVIDAGFGGLAAAGIQTTVLDGQASPGGRVIEFTREADGQRFRYDAGPTALTAPILFEELFGRFGERLADHVELLPVTPWLPTLARACQGL